MNEKQFTIHEMIFEGEYCYTVLDVNGDMLGRWRTREAAMRAMEGKEYKPAPIRGLKFLAKGDMDDFHEIEGDLHDAVAPFIETVCGITKYEVIVREIRRREKNCYFFAQLANFGTGPRKKSNYAYAVEKEEYFRLSIDETVFAYEAYEASKHEDLQKMVRFLHKYQPGVWGSFNIRDQFYPALLHVYKDVLAPFEYAPEPLYKNILESYREGCSKMVWKFLDLSVEKPKPVERKQKIEYLEEVNYAWNNEAEEDIYGDSVYGNHTDKDSAAAAEKLYAMTKMLKEKEHHLRKAEEEIKRLQDMEDCWWDKSDRDDYRKPRM